MSKINPNTPGMLGMSEDLTEAEILIAKNRSGQVGAIPMRYNGDLVRFEDARPLIYQSAMNEMDHQVAAQPKPKGQSYNPNATPASPSQVPYNPFDEFSQNEFVQTDFDGNL